RRRQPDGTRDEDTAPNAASKAGDNPSAPGARLGVARSTGSTSSVAGGHQGKTPQGVSARQLVWMDVKAGGGAAKPSRCWWEQAGRFGEGTHIPLAARQAHRRARALQAAPSNARFG